MKKVIFILLLLLLHSQLAAFVLEPVDTPPQIIHYKCDPALEPILLSDFEIWNTAINGFYVLVRDDVHPDITISYAASYPRLGYTKFVTPREIVIGNDHPGFPDSAILLHELGHFFGLGHSEHLDAIMFQGISKGEPPELSSDDISGIRETLDKLSRAWINVTNKTAYYTFTLDGNPIAVWTIGKRKVRARRFRLHLRPGTYVVAVTYLGKTGSVTVSPGTASERIRAHRPSGRTGHRVKYRRLFLLWYYAVFFGYSSG